MTAAPPETGSNTSALNRALDPGLQTNKIRADVIAAPPETPFNISARDRAFEVDHEHTDQGKSTDSAQFRFQASVPSSEYRKGHMVWVPNRTGSHLGGTWVEVDDKGNEHAESNIETYTARRW